MTQRERSYSILAVCLLVVIVVFGGGWWFYRSWTNSVKMIAETQQKIDELNVTLEKVNSQIPQLERWRRLSLPPNANAVRDDYKQFLIDTMKKTGVLLESFPAAPPDTKSTVTHPTKPGKQAIYTALNFNE